MKILIGADIVPVKSNMQDFENENIDALLLNGLKTIFDSADYRICNLEVPLTDKETPILKCGPSLRASVASAAGIKALGIDFLTLANNHILDHGESGLRSTMQVLEETGIGYAGAGMNPEQAGKPYIVEKCGRKIGIYCCAEHEFSIVEEGKPGANPFDPLESLDHISALKKQCDYTIVLYHGGKEQYRYPAPYLQKVCRKIIEKGADLVICQHTHCIGCEETYLNGTIVYGQGNFLFDDMNNEYWATSLLVQIELDEDVNVSYIPLEKHGASVALAQEKKEKIMSDFRQRSEEIKQPGFIEKKYNEIAASELERYLYMLQGRRYKSYLFRVLNKLSGYRLITWAFQHQYKRNDLPSLINIMDCEVHRECFLQALKKKIIGE